jgi:hypothetical protein
VTAPVCVTVGVQSVHAPAIGLKVISFATNTFQAAAVATSPAASR